MSVIVEFFSKDPYGFGVRHFNVWVCMILSLGMPFKEAFVIVYGPVVLAAR